MLLFTLGGTRLQSGMMGSGVDVGLLTTVGVPVWGVTRTLFEATYWTVKQTTVG